MELFTQHALVAAARDHFPIDVIDAGAVTDGGALAIATLTRPYKIMISLLDKADVGQYILDKIFLDIVSSLKSKCDCNGETKTEVRGVVIVTICFLLLTASILLSLLF